jgi:hypothetical protein
MLVTGCCAAASLPTGFGNACSSLPELRRRVRTSARRCAALTACSSMLASPAADAPHCACQRRESRSGPCEDREPLSTCRQPAEDGGCRASPDSNTPPPRALCLCPNVLSRRILTAWDHLLHGPHRGAWCAASTASLWLARSRFAFSAGGGAAQTSSDHTTIPITTNTRIEKVTPTDRPATPWPDLRTVTVCFLTGVPGRSRCTATSLRTDPSGDAVIAELEG